MVPATGEGETDREKRQKHRIVLSGCGHWWREAVHPDHENDEQGETRICAEHIEPMRYPVYYLPDAPVDEYRVSRRL
jgi:hypothetical protein